MMTMRYLQVSGIEHPMARAVLGTEDYFLADYDSRAEILDAYLAGGGNVLDTARTYGIGTPVGPHAHGESEQLLGRWIRERGVREQVVIVTKGAHRLPKGRGLARMTRAYIEYDIRTSLERLDTDRVEVWMFHRDNPHVEVSRIVDWVNENIDAGLIGAVGASNWSIDRLEAANAYASSKGLQGFSLLSNQFGLATPRQPRWPGTRHVAPEERARLAALGVANQAWSAQCSGFFAIEPGASEHPDPDFRRAFHTPENFARRERARVLAGELGLAPTQVALAYTLNQEFSSLGVFWPANLEELEQCLRAADLVVSTDQIKFLETGEH
jgi:aryl-alcohol dehydrogenase-like predicted oxidoreductase